MTNQVVLPNFILIGGMKCATSTLHEQLAQLDGIVMSSPKEPNFFSDDEQYAKGMSWYSQIFDGPTKCLKGESSTHYTKFPNYPKTIERMQANGLSDAKFIYVIRHPIDRLVSHYIHEWSQSVISEHIDDAIFHHPELIDYSSYFKQLSHYLDAFSRKQILLVFYDSLISRPQFELTRICQFIGYRGDVNWDFGMEKQNVSAQRIKRFPLDDFFIHSKPATFLRRAFVPRSLRNRVKKELTMSKRPELSSQSKAHLEAVFNKDLLRLGQLFGIKLNVDNFKNFADGEPLSWVGDSQNQYNELKVTR